MVRYTDKHQRVMVIGHPAEELRHPIAPDIYSAIDRNAVYRPTASNDITEPY
jgi:hypothetical protein